VLALIANKPYRAITAVIDKREHRQKYKVWRFQPYHYCLTVILERYVRWLEAGDLRVAGDVMAESRGKKENKQLASSYQRIYEHGTDFLPAALFQRWLTSGEIKLKSKTDNVAGLQLADLIANPACRDLICRHTGVEMTAEFGRRIVEALYAKKYVRSIYDGKIEGYGTKWLP
jgi:hypothetical protein